MPAIWAGVFDSHWPGLGDTSPRRRPSRQSDGQRLTAAIRQGLPPVRRSGALWSGAAHVGGDVSNRRMMELVLSDYDFHPDEATVRIFRTPTSGVLRIEDQVAITEAIYDDVVLRHYSFADQWFKINVTTDLAGNLVETGAAEAPFAFNCDIATPMERENDSTYGVDLFIDVLVRADTRSYVVGDEAEFEEMLDRGLVSRSEEGGARQGLRELLDLVESGHLLPWLHERAPFLPTQPPVALPMERGPIPERLQVRVRRTW